MSKSQVKSVYFHKAGNASVLQIESHDAKEPASGEVRINVEAIGLNRAEVMFREAQYLEAPVFPARLGYEASGTIDAVGEGVTQLKVGERVSTIPSFSMGQYGVYGQSAIMPEHAAVPYPESLSAVEGASIWMQYLTAFGALIELGQLQKEQTVLITAASSSVGLAAIQIAKQVGATAIVTSRTSAKKAALLSAGADHVVVTDDEDLVDRVMSITDGQGADLIFDPIAGAIVEQLAAAAAQGATLIEYGALSSEDTAFPLMHALAKGLTIRGYTLFEIVQDEARLQRGISFVENGLASGSLKPILDKNFKLEDIQQAHEYMESNKQFGKITVSV